jgi:hypothetical protein
MHGAMYEPGQRTNILPLSCELRATSFEQTGCLVLAARSSQPGSERPLVGVVSRPIMRLIRTSGRRVRQVHPQLAEI